MYLLVEQFSALTGFGEFRSQENRFGVYISYAKNPESVSSNNEKPKVPVKLQVA